jgi:Zn-dependent protease
MACISYPGERAYKALETLIPDLQPLRLATNEQLATGSHQADTFQALLVSAAKEARLLGHHQIDTFHVLLAFLYDPNNPIAQLLTQSGAALFELRTTIQQTKITLKAKVAYPSLAGVIQISPIFLGIFVLMIINGAALWLGIPERFVQPCTILFVLSGWIVSVCIHEFGHALAAYLGGDTTVREAGYLTLNPLRYTNPIFSIILPLLIVLTGGIGLPGGAVLIRPNLLRSKAWDSFVSAAGPLGTLLFLILIGWPFWANWYDWITEANYYFWPALAFLVFLQVTALFFNLLPIPPLDGFGILSPLMTWEARQRAMLFGNVSMLLLFVVLSYDTPIRDILWTNIFLFAEALQVPIDWAIEGRRQLYGQLGS